MNCNGRVNIVSPDTNVMFKMKEQVNVKSTDYTDAMIGNWSDTILSKTFFSSKNIDILQNGLRAGVYDMSDGKYIIERQNEDELKIIMRSIFLQYSRNNPDNIPQQIHTLNKLVLDYSVKQVYGEAVGYNYYKMDISSLNVPIAPPQHSRPNNKQLELKNWF